MYPLWRTDDYERDRAMIFKIVYHYKSLKKIVIMMAVTTTISTAQAY